MSRSLKKPIFVEEKLYNRDVTFNDKTLHIVGL